MNITGTIVNYYIHCKRQCYLSVHKINLEGNSELVAIGKAIHEQKAKINKNSEISIENIKIDKISDKYITEIKKSDADIEAATMQLKYYMYILNKKGIKKDGKIEVIDNKKENKITIIPYTEELEKEVETLIDEIENFINSNIIPPFLAENKCKKCAYYEYCAL